MILNNLTKEQKQYAALGVLAASIVVILMVLGIRFSMATVSAAREELDDLSDKINKANRALSRSRQTSENYVETITVLGSYLKNAPPERNYYSWATEVIYSTARFAGLEIDSIDEISIPQRKRSGSGDPGAISFESYSLRIVAHGGYENTKYFLNLLNQDYPLVRFSGVEISSGQSRDKHNIQLYIQWPFNFGEISKNWDALASKKIKVAESSAGPETPVLEESEPEDTPAAPESSVARSNVALESSPPPARPVAEETPAPEPVDETTFSETQSGIAVDPLGIPSAREGAPEPATDAELEDTLSYVPSSEPEITDADPQSVIAVSEAMADPMPEQELEAAAVKPAAVLEPEIVSGPDPEPMIEEEKELLLISEFESPDPSPVTEEAPADAMADAGSELDTPSVLEVDAAPEPLVGPPSDPIGDETDQAILTDNNEKNSEEFINEESAEEAVSMSSLLEDMMGVSNEK